MQILPWRVKNFLSESFPLLYHLAVNAGKGGGNSAEHWDRRLAETWDGGVREWPKKTALIASLVPPDAALIDIGCGNGGILRGLKQLGFSDLHGLEISDYAVNRLASEGIQMHKGVLPRIELPDNRFDVLVASQVLEHIIRRRFFVREMHRILKPGGQALIFVPDRCLGPIDEPEHVVMFNPTSLRRELEASFVVDEVRTIKDDNHVMPILFARVSKKAH
ncbi:class I SAM-dependent methyltransferase [Aquincola sp. S2]|uniref:Class I SAM-dependent methyltransferase n=1 Tax=Pseudaquabacterium terrae TaxID=2732868 RepID=A0ABX2ECW5_9BURK|nr:class I SAM-dependent methyltransferase [Aquabacterium terrae]NRF66521.1 class I SAM-dependent methyltransferase [Aquabacterium terrae]